MSLTQANTDDSWNFRVELRPGKTWPSFEQFRLDGPDGLRNAITENRVGFLRVKGDEFVLLRRVDFDRLYALARDLRRVGLLRGAVEWVRRSKGEETAISHLVELTMTFPTAGLSIPEGAVLDVDVEDSQFDVKDEIDPAVYVAPRARLAADGRD